MSVTFALLCYNQEKFIREALRGAFRQDYQPLEILISDDHSTDASFDILREEVANYSLSLFVLFPIGDPVVGDLRPTVPYLHSLYSVTLCPLCP